MIDGGLTNDIAMLVAHAKLARSHSLAMRASEASAALLDLGRALREARDRDTAEQCVMIGRRLAVPEALDLLLAAAERPLAQAEDLAAALRFGGRTGVAALLQRLNAAKERGARRTLFNLAVALGVFPELRGALVTSLTLALRDGRWEVVRNAITLLTALGEPLPSDQLWDLAHAPHRQVRLALVQVVARWRAGPEGLELLLPMLEDRDDGVRFAAAVALGAYPHPRAREALARRVERETDQETRAICAAALRRRVVALRAS